MGPPWQVAKVPDHHIDPIRVAIEVAIMIYDSPTTWGGVGHVVRDHES